MPDLQKQARKDKQYKCLAYKNRLTKTNIINTILKMFVLSIIKSGMKA